MKLSTDLHARYHTFQHLSSTAAQPRVPASQPVPEIIAVPWYRNRALWIGGVVVLIAPVALIAATAHETHTPITTLIGRTSAALTGQPTTSPSVAPIAPASTTASTVDTVRGAALAKIFGLPTSTPTTREPTPKIARTNPSPAGTPVATPPAGGLGGGTPSPSPSPSDSPSPSASPDPTPTPSPTPSPSATPSPSPTPSASPDPILPLPPLAL